MNFYPNSSSSSYKKVQDFDLKCFKILQNAKFCVAFVLLTSVIVRLIGLLLNNSLSSTTQTILIISLPVGLMVVIVIVLEYLLFKKKGPEIVKYSNLLDAIVLFFFMGEWTTALCADLFRPQQSNPTCFPFLSLYSYTAFSWRTLLVTLIVQKWQLKVIAPISMTWVVAGYALYLSNKSYGLLITRAIVQTFNIFLIIYCEDKMKSKLMRTNIEQEKWMQVNNFILNNIPENIIVLNLAGEVKFISEYCKSFMKKCNSSLDEKEFFKRVQGLQQQHHFESDSPPASPGTITLNMERLTTYNELLGGDPSNKIEVLEEVIGNFTNIVKDKNLQEKQFLIYNGKLKLENNQQEKSLEVKISFVQHFEDDCIILIFRDTTQRDLLVTLEETNRYKDQLLASVSHELRAPLNGNINLVEGAVNSPTISQNIKETLLIPALRSSKFLLRLINDILDMSQIKEKKLRLVFESGDLKETLKSTGQLIELQAKKKGIDFQLNLHKNLPKSFCTDHMRVSQIVLNLLSNAIKLTKEGIIKLSAVKVENTDWAKVSVEDSGIGISQENLDKLFLNYTQIEFEGRQIMNPTGVGLGLNIASNLTELLAPQEQPGIRVVSVPNQGSTFSFLLENKDKIEHDYDVNNKSCEIADELVEIIQPKSFEKLKTLPSSTSVVEKQESQSEFFVNACSCPKVLIVDDNSFNTMALETILNSLEIKCESVYNGSDCIKKLLGHQGNTCGSKECQAYSVVFMDQEMPEMSGADTVREIRRLQSESMVSEMKVIGCTAHKVKEEVDRFLASGLDLCIYKPVSIALIKETLKGSLC